MRTYLYGPVTPVTPVGGGGAGGAGGGATEGTMGTMPPGSVFLLTAHHIALDGWSLDVMLRDLGVLYDRRVLAGVREGRVREGRALADASATRDTREEKKQGGDEESEGGEGGAGSELASVSLPRLHVRVTDLASAYKGESCR